jgi:hypothetical protein
MKTCVCYDFSYAPGEHTFTMYVSLQPRTRMLRGFGRNGTRPERPMVFWSAPDTRDVLPLRLGSRFRGGSQLDGALRDLGKTVVIDLVKKVFCAADQIRRVVRRLD